MKKIKRKRRHTNLCGSVKVTYVHMAVQEFLIFE